MDREAGLVYLEMMFLSYDRLILTSCLPLRGLFQSTTSRKEFSKSRLLDREAGLIYLEMMFLSYDRNRHELHVYLTLSPINDFKKKSFRRVVFLSAKR
ncbi:MAG: hypothetical protein ACYCQJ_15620, partial [Nitrososphaerales archaeon]